ncbi:MAG TPA: catechol 1,2-dioxygenase [Methylomirabilota bacterium]|jgi:catechol 2,3-dioxygenase-like lactoylglutathione lyase family enzyme
MALIKVKDLAYGRLRAPDLDVMEEFLTHFGMIRAARTPTALYMRGTDPAHHIHVTEKGDPAFIGFAYYAASEADLQRVARAPGASAVEKIDEPGGGQRVRLKEPNGFQIEVVHGIETLPPIPVPVQPMNTGTEPLRRAGELMRLRNSPSPIKRIGHGVMGTPNVRETVRWFQETLGFISSDDVYVGTKDNLIGSFNRCDRGDEYTDHHTLFCVRNERAGLNHLSFEVPDVDAVFRDHQYLEKLGKYEHMWGVGRHLLGSQVYDYWCDPWRRVHERWADTDRLNAKSGSNLLSAEEALVSQWGEGPPEKFIRHVSV